MTLPFDKVMLFIGVKYNLDAVKVLDEIFTYLPMYVFDEPPLEYIIKRLEEMILPKSILAGKHDLKAYVGFLKRADLMDLNEAWDRPEFKEFLYDSDLRRTVDIMRMCSFRQEEILLVVKDKYSDIDEKQCQIYIDCFADFQGMQFIAKKNFVYSYIGNPAIQRLYMSCLENRSMEHIRSVLNITMKSIDPMTLATRAAQISMLRTTKHLVDENDQELRNYLNINMKSAALLQSLGAGSVSAVDELRKLMEAPSENTPVKVYTLAELEAKKIDISEESNPS